jgi:hypothetical protein
MLQKPILTFGGLGLIAVMLAPPVHAQGMGQGKGMGGGGGMAVVTALCGKEIAAHCAASPRGPATRTCLEARAKDLGENCRLAVEATGPDRGQGSGPVAQLCMNEIGKFCAGIEHGSGLVRDCLEKRKSELGEGCNAALDNTGWGRKR